MSQFLKNLPVGSWNKEIQGIANTSGIGYLSYVYFLDLAIESTSAKMVIQLSYYWPPCAS